jgi:enoyl-CoA hydratase/carnithine racemase
MTDSFDTSSIQSEILEGVMSIIINRPKKKNSLHYFEFQKIAELINKANKDPNVKVIFITSIGDVFCAGLDFGIYFEYTYPEIDKVTEALFKSLIKCEKIVIVAVNGRAIGVGLTMLLHADCVFCAEGTTFSTPFLKVGLFPEGCSSFIFPQRFGNSVTTNLIFGDGVLSANDAKNFGLVLEILPQEKLNERAKNFAKKIASNNAQRLVLFKQMMTRYNKEKLLDVNNYELSMIKVFSENSEEFQKTKKSYLKPKF